MDTGLFAALKSSFSAIFSYRLLASSWAAYCWGAGVGLIMRNGAGTGGTDGLALALNKWTHISTARWVSIVDIAILVVQAFFSAFDQILYGVVLTVVSSIILNRVILLGQSQLQLFIIINDHIPVFSLS